MVSPSRARLLFLRTQRPNSAHGGFPRPSFVQKYANLIRFVPGSFGPAAASLNEFYGGFTDDCACPRRCVRQNFGLSRQIDDAQRGGRQARGGLWGDGNGPGRHNNASPRRWFLRNARFFFSTCGRSARPSHLVSGDRKKKKKKKFRRGHWNTPCAFQPVHPLRTMRPRGLRITEPAVDRCHSVVRC